MPFERSLLRPSFLGVWIGVFVWMCIVKMLPWSCLMALGRTLGRIMFACMPGRRYVVKRNVELAFPDLSDEEKRKLEKDIFLNAGMAVFETGIAWFWSDRRFMKLLHADEEDLKKARELAATDPRMLVLSLHLVNLEAGARSYALLIKPGVGVYRRSDHPVWEYVQVKYRLRCNNALVDRRDVRSMVKVVMRGEFLWYMPDQDFGPNVSIFVPFFGVDKAATVQGTHDLARIRGTLVQPYWLTRVRDGYKVNIRDVLENFPTEDAAADTARCNKILEEMIMCDPGQYLWMHRRFKTAPEGEQPRYPKVG